MHIFHEVIYTPKHSNSIDVSAAVVLFATINNNTVSITSSLQRRVPTKLTISQLNAFILFTEMRIATIHRSCIILQARG